MNSVEYDMNYFAPVYAVLKRSEKEEPIWYDPNYSRDVPIEDVLEILESILMVEKEKLQENQERQVYEEEIEGILEYITKREIVEDCDEVNVSKVWWMKNREPLLEVVEKFFNSHLRKYYFND